MSVEHTKPYSVFNYSYRNLCYINELFVFKKDKYKKCFAKFDKEKKYLLYYGIYVVSLIIQFATFYLLLMEIVA